MKEAIQKAIEGGYTVGYKDVILVTSPNLGTIEVTKALPSVNDIFLDPDFWQALGKAMGWKDLKERYEDVPLHVRDWVHVWHRFIDHLAEGKDSESFFSGLLK